MKGIQIAKRYARLLSGMLTLQELSEEIPRLERVASLIESDKRIKGFFINPLFTDEEKKGFLGHISERVHLHEKTRNILERLIEERVFMTLSLFVKFLSRYYSERRRLLKATILSAIPVDGGIVERVANALRNMTSRDVVVETALDPSILGGIVVRFDNTVYDLSLKGQLNLLKNEIIKG